MIHVIHRLRGWMFAALVVLFLLMVAAPTVWASALGSAHVSGAPVPTAQTSDLPKGFAAVDMSQFPTETLFALATRTNYASGTVTLGRVGWSDGRRGVVVVTARVTLTQSSSEEGASVVQHDANYAGYADPSSAVPGLRGAVDRVAPLPPQFASSLDGHEVVLRSGSAVAIIVAIEPKPAPSALADLVAQKQAARMGAGSTDQARINELGTNASEAASEMLGVAVVPVALWIIALEMLDRSGNDRRGRDRYRVEGLAPASWEDVSAGAAQLHSSARTLFIYGLIPALAGVLGLTLTLSHPVAGPVIAAIGAVTGVALWAGIQPGRRSPRYRPTTLAGLVGVLALALLVAALWFIGQGLNLLTRSDAELELKGQHYVSTVFLVIALLMLGLASGCWRYALRLSHTRPSRAVLRDPRPRVLYLRSFRDDALHLTVAPFARSGLIERLSGRRRQSFEEIVAEELQQKAPVTAVGEPGRSLPPLGFARESLDPKDWRAGVRARVEAARAVVVVLGRSEGLGWELRLLVESGAWRKTIVLIPPVAADELRDRWAPFAGLLLELGFRMADLPPEPPHLLALCFTSDHTCRWFVGDRLSAWGYKAAITAALANATSE